MTIPEKREDLRNRYIKWYVANDNLTTDENAKYEDAKYTWWSRENQCQRWCKRQQTFVPMSDTDTLKVMRTWFKECRNR